MKSLIYPIFTLCLLAGVLSCGRAEHREQVATDEKEPGQFTIGKEEFEASGLVLDSVMTTMAPVRLKLNGVIDVPPNNKAMISALKGGFIKNIPVLEGEEVKKNQYLATVESLEFLEIQKKYLETGQDLEYLKAEYERQRQLFDERISSEKKFQQAENTYKSKQIQHSELREVLRMLHFDTERIDPENLRSSAPVLSPFDGHVSRVYVHSGVHVSAGEPIMEVINAEHLHIELKVFEKDAIELQLDQSVRFKVPEVSDQEFLGKLYRIGKVIHEDRTVMVHVDLDNGGQKYFLPGMYVEAEVEIGEEPVHLIHKALVRQSGFKYFVFELVGHNDRAYVFERRSLNFSGEQKDHFILSDSIEKWQGKTLLKGDVESVGIE